MSEPAKFEIVLRDNLKTLGIDLPAPLWKLINWLENQGQCFTYTSSEELFLSLDLVPTKDDLRNHIHFNLPPPDMMRYWLDKAGYEREIIPLVRCGADGSYFALWFHDSTENPRFVFLGSEGECFVVSETVQGFITLITMGYFSIEGRDVLAASPREIWDEVRDDLTWKEPTELKAWAKENLATVYPETGSELLPYTEEKDPFIRFINDVVNS